jgi:type I restriction enzyme, S subunit
MSGVLLDEETLSNLPSSWMLSTVEDVFEIPSGKTPSGIDTYEQSGDVPFFKVADMNHPENIPMMNISKINLKNDDLSKLKISTFPTGTIIFPKRGGAIKTNKKRILAQPSCFDLNIMGLVSNVIPFKYTYYWIYGLDLMKISDGSNVPQINLGNIQPLNFPLPPLDEQKRIVSKIDELFSKIDATENYLKKIVTLLENKSTSVNSFGTVIKNVNQIHKFKLSILKQAFSGKLIPQNPDDESVDILLQNIQYGKEQLIKKQKPSRWKKNVK